MHSSHCARPGLKNIAQWDERLYVHDQTRKGPVCVQLRAVFATGSLCFVSHLEMYPAGRSGAVPNLRYTEESYGSSRSCY